jgi:outer membrane protein assembly factor BamB
MKASVLPVLAIILSWSLAAPVAFGAQWDQYGFAANHTSFNNLETTLTRSNVASLTRKWAGVVGTSIASAPVVGQGNVYVAADGEIFAFAVTSGQKVWSRQSCSGIGTVEAALSSGVLLVGDDGGDLAGYVPETGKQIWCGDENGSITSAPATAAGIVYSTNGADVIALEASTGNFVWSFTPANFSPVTNTPAVLGSAVYVTGGDSVFALDRATGHKLWRTNLGTQTNISAPAVAGSTVYVGGNHLYALSTSDGHILWTKTSVGVNVSTPAVANGKVYVNSEDPGFGLWAFNASSGAFVWRSELPGESLATVTIANGVVFDIADTGELVMLNSDTGALSASLSDPDGHPFNSNFGAQAAVVNGSVYVPTADLFGTNQVDSFQLP